MKHDPNIGQEARARDWQRQAIERRKRHARQAAAGSIFFALVAGVGMHIAMLHGRPGAAAVLAIAGSLCLMLTVIAASEA